MASKTPTRPTLYGERAMRWVTRPLRTLSMLRFRALGLAIIEDVPTAQFREIERRLVAEGWVKTYEYTGFDAWIDYGEVLLRRGRARLSFEWDNWSEGRIEGVGRHRRGHRARARSHRAPHAAVERRRAVTGPFRRASR